MLAWICYMHIVLKLTGSLNVQFNKRPFGFERVEPIYPASDILKIIIQNPKHSIYATTC